MQIVAEIGSNWRRYENNQRNWEVAKTQIQMAKEFGATAVKFQYFTCQELYGPDVKGTKFEKDFDRFALPEPWLFELSKECEKVEIKFMCSAFSLEGYKAVDPLVEVHKVASPEAIDPVIMNWVRECGKHFYYSDGCGARPRRDSGIPMACVSNYPADFLDYNLYYEDDWGLSDHTLNTDLVHMALGAGATHFERHVDFCKDGSLTPDSCVSSGKDQWAKWVKAIRNFDPDRYDKIKQNSRDLYGRRETKHGWFRPIPKTADLRKP